MIAVKNRSKVTHRRGSAAPKNLAFKNRLAMLLTFALKEIGEGNVTEEQKHHIANLLKNEDKSVIEKDYSLMPNWIQLLISKLL